MAYPENVLIGDRVRWTSDDGQVRGEVSDLVQKPNSGGKTINWIGVDVTNGIMTRTIYLAETDLESLEFKVIFRGVAVTGNFTWNQ